MAAQPMTVADFLAAQLAAWGADRVFGVPGDTVLALIEAIRREPRLEFVPARSSAAAGLMAAAYAKASGRLGVCLADLGPGAIQLLAGVYDAKADRVPLIALTGGLETERAGTGRPGDADLDLAYRDATVYNRTLCDPLQAPPVLQAALRQAVARPGPARVGLPRNLLRESIPEAAVRPRPAYLDGYPRPDPRALEAAVSLLDTAERPVIFAGRGAAGAVAHLLQLAEALPAAIVHTLPAIGIIPGDHPHNLGVLGEGGTPQAADALGRADVVLVVGSTWWEPDYVARGARIIQVDAHLPHLDLNFAADVAVAGRAEDVLPELVEKVKGRRRAGWGAFIAEARRAWDAEVRARETEAGDGIAPPRVVTALAGAVARDAVIALDVGNNTLWFGRYFRGKGQQVLLSGHWRCLGFALPAAVAARLAWPDRQVVALTGDGGLGSFLGEFLTAVHRRLPVTVVVLKDGLYGQEWARQRQWGLAQEGVELAAPDFAAWARAAGGVGFSVTRLADLAGALTAALAAGRPAIVDVAVRPLEPPVITPPAARERPAVRPDGQRPAPVPAGV